MKREQLLPRRLPQDQESATESTWRTNSACGLPDALFGGSTPPNRLD